MSVKRPTNVVLLGSTGSIGASTLDVAARHPDRFRIHALAARRQDGVLFDQCRRYRPRHAVLTDPDAAARLAAAIEAAGLPIEVHAGAEALDAVASAPEADCVVAAIVGAAGLSSTLAAAAAGKRILLANKEALVMSGALLMEAVRSSGALLLPVDSEHNAVFQVLPRDADGNLERAGVHRILLTASGGPLRELPLSEFADVTPERAVRHPNWSMGRKISVDSATMMNKGLEVIEACWLFNARPEQVEIVIHPESIVHSLVSYKDGSVLAQLGNPDMRTPIAHALAFPERIETGVEPLDLARIARLRFEPVDYERFPCPRIAYDAMRAGGTAPAILNAANEIAVEAFLERRVPFDAIPRLVESALDSVAHRPARSLADVLEDDARARRHARAWIEQHPRRAAVVPGPPTDAA
jgi:1-deoxy-D-xylulose-5-phosphate reductoisomerase